MNYIQKILIPIVFLAIVVSLFPSKIAASEWTLSQDAPSQVLQIRMTYDNGDVTINSAQIQKGAIPKEGQLAKDYAIIAKDKDGIELYRKVFSIPRDVFSLPPFPGSLQTPELIPKLPTKFQLSEIIKWDPLYKTIEIQNKHGETLSHIESSSFVRKNNHVSFFTRQNISELSTNAVTDTLDITFIGDNYTTSDLPKFHADVLKFSNKLLEFSPFTEYASKIAFHYVDNTLDLGCTFSGRIVICDSFLVYLTVQLSGSPYDRVAVIVNDPTYAGATYQELVVTTNGEFEDLGFVHEFGHGLSYLSDEYIVNSSGESLDKNCYAGTPPNQLWQTIPGTIGYYLGCNYSDYYRSSPDSIMRSLTAPYFNDVSQKYLKESLDFYTSGTSLTPTSIPSETPKQGDANGDGKVDGIDYVAWLSHYNQDTTNGFRDGDFNTNGKVDGVDFVIWLNNYGK
jgi:hypothetical protein